MVDNDDKNGKSTKADEPEVDDDAEDLDAEFAAFEAEAKAAAAKAAARMAGIGDRVEAAPAEEPPAEADDDEEEEEDEFAAFEREAKEAAAAAAARMGGGATGSEAAPEEAPADEDEDEEDEFAAFEREAKEAAAAAAARMGGGASGDEAATDAGLAASSAAEPSAGSPADDTGKAGDAAEEAEASPKEIAAARAAASATMANFTAPGKGAKSQTIVVIGGGIAGITAAVEVAETGYEVLLLEKEPYLGGRVTRLNRYFPKLCHPTCGLEINYQRIKKNPRIKLMTMAEVTNVSGERGDYRIDVRTTPRHVNAKCTACGDCAKAAETTISDPFNYGLGEVKAAYLPHEHAFPMRYVVAPEVVGTTEGEKIKAACKYDAIDLDEQETTIELAAGAIIWATGWRPYDAAKIEVYSYSQCQDIINNVEMERLASHRGPTGGKITRPSDGAPAKRVAMIQCAGSRDHNHLPYCSMICCLGSLKHAAYVREQYEDAEIDIYYIDIRAHDKMSSFYERVRADDRIRFIKSKPGSIVVGDDGKPVVCGELTIDREIYRNAYDLVVLATGMEPNRGKTVSAPEDLVIDEYGFVVPGLEEGGGQFSAGVAAGPVDVALSTQSGTAAALKAIQAIRAG